MPARTRHWMRGASCAVLVASLLACRPASREPSRPDAPARATPPASLVTVHGTRPGRTLVALHDNEDDAASTARRYVDLHGGRLIEVRAQGSRHVTQVRNGRAITFDPNRVFTDAGLRATLAERGTRLDAVSFATGKAFADQVLRLIDIDQASLVIAVHNNSNGVYSARSYMAGAPLAGDAAAVHMPAGVDADHFFLVTTRALFNALVPAGYPVVLQDNARATDDGSLSILCARRGIAYVNVEAEHGRADVQRAMLDALHRALPAASATTRR